ncbi:hypothetical protein ACFY1U_15125 [Streptomyces sp. NPDC001351]|uniref:hypothetical protein n=1 Tax=Streptomyces sp. NPDC001351 TaxID=3364564 RepID=UPI0036CF36B2
MIGGLFALSVLVALAVRFVVAAVRLWGHPERAPEAARSFSVRGAPGWVIARGIVVVAAHFVLMAIAVIALGTAVTQTRKPAGPWWAISLAAGSGVILCWLLIILIGIFNRPRFLVVPYLRDKRRL